jgi:three-Cys-motif partner protein
MFHVTNQLQSPEQMVKQEFGGDWTKQKLQILDDYLTAYCKIFQVNPGARHLKTLYVDAFAGSGLIGRRSQLKNANALFAEFTESDTIQFLEGSAAQALQHSFNQYIFIEKSGSRIAELEKLKAQSSKRSQISLRKGDANVELEELVKNTNWSKSRAVVFLDPYGMQVNWDTIVLLGKTGAVDLWLLFPLGQAVMRLLRKEGDPPAEWQQALDRIFGTHDWYSRFYRTEKQQDLFDEEVTATFRIVGANEVASFMIERLETAFSAVAKNPGTLYNSQNAPLYLFCFASANPKGAPTALKIANYLLKRLT